MLLGDGKRGFVEEKNAGELPAEREGCTGWMVRLKDLDGDHRDEVVIAYAGEPSGYPGMADMSVARLHQRRRPRRLQPAAQELTQPAEDADAEEVDKGLTAGPDLP